MEAPLYRFSRLVRPIPDRDNALVPIFLMRDANEMLRPDAISECGRFFEQSFP